MRTLKLGNELGKVMVERGTLGERRRSEPEAAQLLQGPTQRAFIDGPGYGTGQHVSLLDEGCRVRNPTVRIYRKSESNSNVERPTTTKPLANLSLQYPKSSPTPSLGSCYNLYPPSSRFRIAQFSFHIRRVF